MASARRQSALRHLVALMARQAAADMLPSPAPDIPVAAAETRFAASVQSDGSSPLAVTARLVHPAAEEKVP